MTRLPVCLLLVVLGILAGCGSSPQTGSAPKNPEDRVKTMTENPEIPDAAKPALESEIRGQEEARRRMMEQAGKR